MSKFFLGIHAFTVCDTVNPFPGKDKLTAYKNVQEKGFQKELFSLLGS